MTITADFGPDDIRMQVEKTGIKGRHLTFINDFTAKELDNIFKTAVMLEPYWRSRTPLLEERYSVHSFFSQVPVRVLAMKLQ